MLVLIPKLKLIFFVKVFNLLPAEILLPPVPEYLLKTLSFVFAASTFNTKNCSLPKERISFGAIFSRFVINCVI